MIFKGISRTFSLLNEDQYNTIGAFWDKMAAIYGLENLHGLGYNWRGDTMDYAIGLKLEDIADYNVSIALPDNGWTTTKGKTDKLKELYAQIYKDGALKFEIESFFENGACVIKYYR